MSASPTGRTSLDDRRDVLDTVIVAFAGFTVLVWDHLITFDDEIELVWRRDKGLLSYLFLLNRYLTPLGFVVNLVAFTLPGWKIETFGTHSSLFFLICDASHSCQHFVRYEGAMTVIGIQIAGWMMFFRVRALYNQMRVVIWSVIVLFLIWLGVNAWLLTKGEAVPHASGVHSCSMIFKASPNTASASAWLPLLYDTYIFALILYKTKNRSGYLVRRLLNDGIQYYSVLCIVNTVLTIMIVRTGPGIRNVAAQLELLLTVAMVSRITLNLRKQVSENTVLMIPPDWMSSKPPRTMRSRSMSVGKMAKARQRGNSVTTVTPRQNTITFRSEPASPHPEYIPLSTFIQSTKSSKAQTRAEPSLVSNAGGSVESV